MMTGGYYKVEGEAKNLLEENWDFLIILDACRYDYFKDLYRNYLDGEVKKAISPGISTPDWVNKVFTDFYDDIVYISANPQINSKIGVAEDEHGLKFDAKKHFYKVIDVWKWGWNDEFGTVLPSQVNKAILKVKDDYKKKRFILHYVQPHEPYISKRYKDFIPSNYIKVRDPSFFKEKKLQSKILKYRRAFIGNLIYKTLGIRALWKFKNLCGIPCQPSLIYSKEGFRGLRRAYKENLEVVLENVAYLLENISGNILITADHGEYLGENGRYGHLTGFVPRGPPVVEVPWLVIKKDKSKSKLKEVSDKGMIKERIKMLKKVGKI